MAADGKICVVCGQDCSARPRVKDAQARYACRACADAKRGAAKAAAAAEREPIAVEPVGAGADAGLDGGFGDDDLLALEAFSEPAAAAPVAGRACPGCGSAVAPDAVICLNCGTNLSDGTALKTKVLKADKPKKAKKPGGGITLIEMGPWAAFGLMFAVNFVPGLLILADPGLQFVVSLVNGVIGLILLIATIIVAFQEDQGVWGGVLIALFVPFVNLLAFIPALIYVFFFCPRVGYRAAWGGQLLGSIGGAVIGATMVVGSGMP